MDGLGSRWGACCAHFTALAVEYTPETVHSAMTAPNPTLATPPWPRRDCEGRQTKGWPSLANKRCLRGLLKIMSQFLPQLFIQEVKDHMDSGTRAVT